MIKIWKDQIAKIKFEESMTFPDLTKACFLVENDMELEKIWKHEFSRLKYRRIHHNLIILLLKVLKKRKKQGRLESFSLLNLLEINVFSFINCIDERDLIEIYNEFLEGDLASIDFLEKIEEKLFHSINEDKSTEA